MAICFKDKTFCASPNCKNECGRKMSDEELAYYARIQLNNPDAILPVCYGHFCGEPNAKLDLQDTNVSL